MKIQSISIILLLFFYASAAKGQAIQTDQEKQQQMKALSFMAGKWKGSGWVMTPQRERKTFEQTEEVQFMLDSTLMLVEGMGTSAGELHHHAVALISYDKQSAQYQFDSHLVDGRSANATAELKDGAFIWKLEMPGRDIRYTIRINEKGEWHEVGEVNQNGQWYQFFEMTLQSTTL